jgi:MFS family permease
MDLFTAKYIKPLSLVTFLMVIRHWTGVYAILSFAVDIFAKSNSSIDLLYSAIIIGAIQFISQFISVLMMGKFGKKNITVVSTLVMTISRIGTMICFILPEASLGWLPVVCMCVFLTAFSLGLSTFPYILMAEILPHEIRDIGGGFCFLVNGMSFFAVTQAYFELSNALNMAGIFGLYAGMCFLNAAVTFFLAPDTAGKSLGELQT